ncbi:MAG TPA: hypothetical protein VKF32_13735, partial [Thermoanaerobaculia bacterium]|nr:hypothetical protein [Thermoanaerobaculia bacterium]
GRRLLEDTLRDYGLRRNYFPSARNLRTRKGPPGRGPRAARTARALAPVALSEYRRRRTR